MSKAPVEYIPDFLEPDVAQHFFDVLWAELDWERREGAPRREYWTNTLDRDYTYGRGIGVRTYTAKPSHWAIDAVSMDLTQMLDFTYEGCFLNGYEDGRDRLGWHADDDPGIDHTRPIAVITIGAGREIQFKEQTPGSHPEKLMLEPGSLLLMNAGMQSTHLHQIPKAGFVVGPRISLTFRSLIPRSEA